MGGKPLFGSMSPFSDLSDVPTIPLRPPQELGLSEIGGTPVGGPSMATAMKIAKLLHGSPVGGLSSIRPSDRGPLGPGVYASDMPRIAERYGPNMYQFDVPQRDIFQGMKNRFDDNTNPYDVWREQSSKLTAAADTDKKAYIKALFDKMWPEDGYPLFSDLARLFGSKEAAQGLFRKAGYRGLSGFVDGPEYVLFDEVPLK